jgi:hypothetical protein
LIFFVLTADTEFDFAFFPFDFVLISKPVPSGNPDELTRQELDGHKSLFKQSEHFGPTGEQTCWPNPTHNRFKSLHSDLELSKNKLCIIIKNELTLGTTFPAASELPQDYVFLSSSSQVCE